MDKSDPAFSEAGDSIVNKVNLMDYNKNIYSNVESDQVLKVRPAKERNLAVKDKQRIKNRDPKGKNYLGPLLEVDETPESVLYNKDGKLHPVAHDY